MIVSMLRHVVAGLSFLHSAEPPIIHQELRSPKVLLDSSCRAHLSDFQQHTVRPWLLPSSKRVSTAANYRYMASWAARYDTWLLSELTPTDVVSSFFPFDHCNPSSACLHEHRRREHGVHSACSSVFTSHSCCANQHKLVRPFTWVSPVLSHPPLQFEHQGNCCVICAVLCCAVPSWQASRKILNALIGPKECIAGQPHCSIVVCAEETHVNVSTVGCSTRLLPVNEHKNKIMLNG